MAVLTDQEGAPRRLATVLITPRLLLGMLQSDGSRAVRFSGIPDGVRLAGAQLNDEIPAFVLVLEHPDFPEVPDGVMPMPISVDQEGVDLCDRCLIRFGDGETVRGPRGVNYTIFRDARRVERERSSHCQRCGVEITGTPCYKCGYGD